MTGAFNKMAKAAEEVGEKAKEKAGLAEEEEKRKVVDEFARVHLFESPKAVSLTQESEDLEQQPQKQHSLPHVASAQL